MNPEIPDPMTVIAGFYPEDTPLRRLLIRHSTQVRDKALAILEASGLSADAELIAAAAMLHDIGIGRCRAPEILCAGELDYMLHGFAGAAMLREYAANSGVELEACARVCERHTGSGLTASDIRRLGLAVPVRDYLPETREEKLICLADKFFSKSGDMKEKSIERIRHGFLRFGAAPLERFDGLCREFGTALPE